MNKQDSSCNYRTVTELYDSNNNLIRIFPSMTEACEYANQNYGCSKTGLRKYHESKGYTIKSDNEQERKNFGHKQSCLWDLYSPDHQFIETFHSKRDAGCFIKKNIRDISVKLFSDTGKAYGYYVIQKSVETN